MKTLRIAWVGPSPAPLGRVAGMATEVLSGLVAAGHRVDCYIARRENWPARLDGVEGLSVIDGGSRWDYDRWYSKTDLMKLTTGQATRAHTEARLARDIVRAHERDPYDVLLQFSHMEVFGLGRYLDRLPPLIVHPQTHVGGELYWYGRESEIGRRCEPLYRRAFVHLLLRARTYRQRRDARLPAGFICPGRAFRRWIVDDYGIDPARTRVVPNPIDLDVYRPRANGRRPDGPTRIAFISRISVRKGVEDLVALSHRLRDLSGQVQLDVFGGRSQWSDYRPLLDDLEPSVARYHGAIPATDVPEELARTDLLVQPSKYEPFAIIAGEALASGVPVVATDEVGATEEVARECVRIVPPSDVDALEAAVRDMVARLRNGEGPRLRALARSEAERLFAPERVCEQIVDALVELSS